MFKLGLTGGIGSGKTSVCEIFAEQGIDIIEADDVSREVVVPGSLCLQQIQHKFGDDILLKNGSLNRAKLRQRIFTFPEDKVWLEDLLHPAIRTLIIEKLAKATSPYCILSSPLFFETKQRPLVDRVLVVDVPEQTQIERASGRDGVDKTQIKAIMSNQASREERLAQADDVIDNSGDFEITRSAALELHSHYLELALNDS